MLLLKNFNFNRMSEYLDPADEQERDGKKKEIAKDSSASKKGDTKGETKNFPNKKKDFKVLNKDGSLADMPYNNQPGGGAMEGTVGIGT